MTLATRGDILCLIVGTAVAVAVSAASAHPGRTDASGCHTCRTNCSRWGLRTGQYHCHGGRPAVRKPVPPPPPAPPVRVYRDSELSSKVVLPENSIVVRSDQRSAREPTLQVEALTVVDGDTFVARDGEGLYLLKLRDIEAPELEQPYGRNARERLAAQVVGRRIVVWPRKGDGCVIPVRVEVGGQDVAEQLLQQGAAWASPAAPAPWRRIEALARREEAGLWDGLAPEPPWEFRARRRMGGKP